MLEHFGSGSLARYLRRIEELKHWTLAHPELASEWNEAIEENDRRIREAEGQRWEEALLLEADRRLRDMGVRRDVAEGVAVEARLPEASRRFWCSEAMQAARVFFESPESTLVLLGGVGCGKTSAAAWLLFRGCRSSVGEPWRVKLDERKGQLLTAPELARIPKFDDGGRFESMLRIPWLVVDDLGTENGTDYLRERLGELFETRHGNKLRTVYTSNKTSDEFERTYGERIWSRLHQHAAVVGAGNTDLRRSNA